MQPPSLAAVGTLALFTLAKTALACDGYLFCHCYDSNGVPNDAITQTVCNRYTAGQTKMIDVNPWSDGARECSITTTTEGIWVGKSWFAYAFGSCDWSKMCSDAGATGSESSCRDHPPVGDGSYSGYYVLGHS
ncbi:hypothetical protein CTRI78_v003549 [Colletotrichum trifolii]|uniref:Cyanovirin-N domain-containing protein n=1 Tax=Colletotrichum trifolii TaxID=5466 RepID=A0A4R8RNP1_COLTR|nr:hypothetical protein CTRI78_v003549 [Colletotrichum trifolii]